MKLYRPSNGTEGEAFISRMCVPCRKQRHCQLVNRTMLYEVTDPEYPKAWTYDDDGRPTCTRFAPKVARKRSARKQTPAGQRRLL